MPAKMNRGELQISEYEKERLERIAVNKARLSELGLEKMIAEVSPAPHHARLVVWCACYSTVA